MKILIADDDPTLREELKELLRGDGHEVETVSNGEDALHSLQSGGFDVALMDLVMPRATGLDVLHRLEVDRSPTAVVMITGHGSIDIAVEAMKSGAADFLVKPFEVDTLQKTLRSVAEEHQARTMLTRPATVSETRKALLDEAGRRHALLVLLGPDSPPPSGAARVLRIDDAARPPDVFSPSQLYKINVAIDEFVGRTERPVVYAEGLERIEAVHGREDLKAWIRRTGDRCAARDGVLVVAHRDGTLPSEFDAELAGAPLEPAVQGMLESLANPIRRAIVSYVFSSGPSSYSAILKMNFVDSSSKLSFHLQKLLADGLLRKEETGAYVLTEDGRHAWRVLRALREERRRPAILFTPG